MIVAEGQTTVVVQPQQKEGWQEMGARWLFSQQSNTVLLFCILAAIVLLGAYSIRYAIPEHLKQIQAGYEKIEVMQERQIKTVTEAFKDHMDRESALIRDILKVPVSASK